MPPCLTLSTIRYWSRVKWANPGNRVVWHYVGGPLSRRSLCLFWRETKQRPELKISTWPEVGRECQSESWKKEPREKSWQRETHSGSWELTPDRRRDQSAWDSPAAVREDQSRWVGITSSFVEISLENHASVSLHMHKECRVPQLNLLALELTQAHIVRLFFSPTPLIVFLVAMKKCVIPLSEQLDDSLAKTWNGLKKLM